jgi:hypothetical protein
MARIGFWAAKCKIWVKPNAARIWPILAICKLMPGAAWGNCTPVRPSLALHVVNFQDTD